jgi:hypothetical protein
MISGEKEIKPVRVCWGTEANVILTGTCLMELGKDLKEIQVCQNTAENLIVVCPFGML